MLCVNYCLGSPGTLPATRQSQSSRAAHHNTEGTALFCKFPPEIDQKKLITLFFCFATHHPYPTIHSRDHHFSQIASLYTPQKASPPMAIIANIRSHNFALSDISHLTTIPFQLTGLMNLTCSGLKVLTLSQESSHLLQTLWL